MELLDSFHFARPWALILIPIVIVQVLWYLRFRHASNPWRDQMRPDLQQQLLAEPPAQPSYLLWTLVALMLAGIALAGPSWSQQSRPVLSQQDNLVIILDLSLSMLAEDIKPNRITRSKQKLQDLLKARQEGMTALVVYSGNAHTVTPLTQDTATIRNLLPALDPLMMPEFGSSAEAGVKKALELIRQSGFQKGRLLLITDGLEEAARRSIRKQLPKEVRLSLMTVGTATGAPIPLEGQGFVKDAQGNVIISQLDSAELEIFASQTKALIHPMTLNDQDLKTLLPVELDQQQLKEEKAQLPLWIEQGHWFLLPVLPLVALAFRRNWLLMLPLLFLLAPAQPVFAFWPQSPQTQGEDAFRVGNYGQAEQLLQDPLWKGSSYYRQQDYQAAVDEFAKSDTAEAHYNRGNALAKLGRYDEAMSAYSQALEKNPALEDARYNQQLVEVLRQRQQEKNKQKQTTEQQQPQSQTSQNQAPQNQQPQQSPSQQSQPSSGSQNPDQTGQAANGQNSVPSANQLGGQQGQNAGQSQSFSQGQQQSGQSSGTPSAQDADTTSDPMGFGPDANPEGDASETAQAMTQAQATTQTPAEKTEAQETKRAGQPNQNASTLSAQNKSPMSEEELSLEQWLRRVPDDPAGLLRRKFEFEAQQRQEPLPEGRTPW